MKQYKDAIIHAAQLFRHLKGQHAPSSEMPIVQVPLAAARSAARMLSSRQRRLAEYEGVEEDDFLDTSGLDETEGFDDKVLAALGEDPDSMGMGMMGGGGGGGDFLSAFGMLGGGFGDDESEGGGFGGDDMGLEALMENFEQCGVDVEEMTNKALGAYFLFGGAFSNFDPSAPETFPGPDTVGNILRSFKDDDEQDCGDSDMPQLLTASTDYLQCSGINDFFTLTEIESGGLLTQMEEDCKPVMDMVTSMAAEMLANPKDLANFDPDQDMFGEDSELGKLGKKCLKTIFGDNAIGNYIRYEWNNMDKTLGCFSKLAEELPHCVLSSPVDETASVSFPLSLEKKMACLIGSSTDLFTETMCVDFYEELDECLPQEYDDANTDVILAECGEDDTLLGMDASVLSQNKIPAFCTKIYEDNETIDAEEFQTRFDYYNKNREYGWTIKSSTEVESGKDDNKDEPTAASVQSGIWGDGEAVADEAEAATGGTTVLLGKVSAVLVFAAGGLALLIKSRGFGAFSRMPGSDTKYADLAFKVEVPDMA